MKQKVVIKIQMHCDKCRNKALKTAAEVQGVTMVSLEGDEKDRVVVIGDNINTIYLINQLNKKFKCVTVVSIEEVKKKQEGKKDEKKDDKKKDDKKDEKKKEEKPFCAVLCLPAPPHAQCSNCQPKCDHCTKCQGPKCECKCVLICFKCNNPKCDGKCNICIKCESPKCSGHCSSPPKPPTKLESKPAEQPKPQPQPQPQPVYINCPPWCNCPRCYVVPCNPPACNYRVVYESNPDNCSIM
ncbi:pollen-specific leucine-rich repeat extensin-like protein 1 isoform X1 [Arachis stenosperma]|uniref:pollen-specific leucine-rich repeat extensin-like protein 1 isoform X1 n=2 Tax=Arachis stenosperma TaxID=217475 RepID=UPI0025ACBF8B|nr:pollen-specific leucine-rich repeat extensin-like protein 1 isoform X1 [Arachis stenosperma]